MISRLRFARLLGLAFALTAPNAWGDVIVNFNDLGYANGAYDPLSTDPKGPAPGSGSYDNGYDLKGGFTSGGIAFGNSYSTYTYGGTTSSYWGGWSYSNVNDPASTASTSLPDYDHQFAAAPGGAPGGSGNYAIATGSSSSGAAGDFINLGAGLNPVSMLATNTTYSYLSMTQGDSFAKKFGAGDYFELRIFGYSGLNGTGSVVGEVDFYLANFLAGNTSIVNSWTSVNLTKLAGSQSLGFGFASSDVGANGINTPLYFAMDDLDLAPAGTVPEPASATLTLAGLGIAGLAARRRRGAGAARRAKASVGPG